VWKDGVTLGECVFDTDSDSESDVVGVSEKDCDVEEVWVTS